LFCAAYDVQMQHSYLILDLQIDIYNSISFLLQLRKIKTIWSINILSIFICVAFLSGIISILGDEDDDLVRMFLLMLCQHADHKLRNILSMIHDLWVLHAN
jgi:hypothetical protein